jgi:prevent-host-death family protein
MLDLSKDIHSLSEFKRNSLQFLRRLRLSGNPLVLTINGKAALVLQDIESYQKLREQATTHVEIAVKE